MARNPITQGVVIEPILRVNDGYFLLYELNEPHGHIDVITTGVIRCQLFLFVKVQLLLALKEGL